MIRLYSGTPGSGKSLHNARDVIARSRMGKPVIGNFPVDLSRFKKANYTYVPNYELNPEYLINYSRKFFQGKKIKEGAILLVIDECQLMFNSRDWQQKGRSDWLSFFSQHRKYGYDVTLIAQFDRMIDRQIRGVIECGFIHRKLSNYGLGGKIMSILFGGNTFVVVEILSGSQTHLSLASAIRKSGGSQSFVFSLNVQPVGYQFFPRTFGPLGIV